MELRELDWEEISEVYEGCLIKDFIWQERKPLEQIRQLRAQGNYLCLGLFEGRELRAYAFLAFAKEARFSLLDYFAVKESCRSQGCGGELLEKLKERFAGGFILEVENGSDLEEGEEKEICRKRLRFYQKHGICHTNIEVFLWGKPLDVYFFAEAGQEEVHASLQAIYKAMYAENDRKENIRVHIRQPLFS